MSAINNGGDLDVVFKDITSSDSLKGYATSMLTAGLVEGFTFAGDAKDAATATEGAAASQNLATSSTNGAKSINLSTWSGRGEYALNASGQALAQASVQNCRQRRQLPG